jgi:hypothetical protein
MHQNILQIFPILYFLVVLIMGIWGQIVIPETCRAKDYRMFIRAIIVIGIISTALSVSQFYCAKQCTPIEIPITDPLELVADTYLVGFAVLTGATISFSIAILKTLYSNEIGNLQCYNSNFYFRQTLTWITVLSIIIFIILTITLVVRYRERSAEAASLVETAHAEA